jgi:hypothetical protein
LNDTNLDDFEKDFFNPEPKAEAEAEEEAVVEEVVETEEQEAVDETEDDSLANENEDDDETEDEEQDEDEDEEEVVEVPQIKVKRNRAQERIEQLLERERLANDRAHALEVRLAALEAGKEVSSKEEVPNIREQLSADAPSPDAKDKDGEPLYELGEFDPKFIRDLTKFTIEQEMKEASEKAQIEARNNEIKAAQAEINHKWNDNLEKVEAEIPEIRDNIRTLTNTFADLDPGYGEYLASTIMNMDQGPQIMNYLSQNIGEAQKIVASGPAAATLALGRLDARLTKPSTSQEEKRNRQVSKASEPPAIQARGHGGKFTVADDTEDLDAFEKKFFNS